MKRSSFAALALCLASVPLAAQDVGTASGKGVIDRLVPGKTAAAVDVGHESVSFSPRYSWAYRDGKGADAATWIVLTEKQPPVKEWIGAKDPAEARRLWCGKEKASFVALKLDGEMKVDLYFLCPANGLVNTEMLSSANGLQSIALKLASKDKRLKGTLKTGQGNCPGKDGADAYCTPTGEFTFDAPVGK